MTMTNTYDHQLNFMYGNEGNVCRIFDNVEDDMALQTYILNGYNNVGKQRKERKVGKVVLYI